MTSYATCAYPGCYRRISYEPKRDEERPRYCDEHLEHMSNRLPFGVNDDTLYIPVVRK